MFPYFRDVVVCLCITTSDQIVSLKTKYPLLPISAIPPKPNAPK